ncbi:hypothetical protein CRG98_025442 [Punica granatum]|uniref:non-specific serine/threonine protein kinase n=1 Tax=Punica granatum TaxID=22663 RepID=A0A2I0JD83_PUNGR|nr:hypothetical protein CRG98_025442 [Punica granatum]
MAFLAHTMISQLLLALVFLRAGLGSGQGFGFTFNGFRPVDLDLDGIAEITPNGLLRLTNESDQSTSHACYPHPITFKNWTEGSVFSFCTTFVFALISENPNRGHGIAFLAAPQMGFPGSLPSQYLGLFNATSNGNTTNHVFAIELDTIESTEFQDINNNHVGIDINSLVSAHAAPAGYYPDGGAGKFENLTLISGRPMQVWVDYDGTEKRINKTMFVGFSSSTGSFTSSHYILGWSFQMNGQLEGLALSELPNLPQIGKKPTSKLLTIAVPIICLFSISVLILGLVSYIRRKRKFAEILEDWELKYGPHRFKYKDLYIATRGFGDQGLLGAGGFGRVYRGVLPTSNTEVAVKRISHDSRQGMREFVAEIVSIGHLRHRNLVALLGYCRRKGELFLVYDYMPNGSLDKYLFNQPKVTLNWTQRFRVVIHRDIKASNILLDAELNGRLADFGLARLYDHGIDPQSTQVMGTLGYLAPEHTRTSKATKTTDVFSFGAFLLEMATGRRPIEPRGTQDVILVDWVFSYWSRGREILEARDPNLGEDFVAEEVELALMLGLVCSHSVPGARPTMRQAVQYLEADLPMQDLSSSLISFHSSRVRFAHQEAFDDFVRSQPCSTDKAFSVSSSIADSLLFSER